MDMLDASKNWSHGFRKVVWSERSLYGVLKYLEISGITGSPRSWLGKTLGIHVSLAAR